MVDEISTTELESCVANPDCWSMVDEMVPAWEWILSVMQETFTIMGKRDFLNRNQMTRENRKATIAVMVTAPLINFLYSAK
jgi:hypothetical protein